MRFVTGLKFGLVHNHAQHAFASAAFIFSELTIDGSHTTVATMTFVADSVSQVTRSLCLV